METLEAIKTRRSIRKYKKEDVSTEIINNALDAAMMAPSAGNAQTWEFIVIKEKEILNSLSEIHKYARMAKDAPGAIVVSGNISREVYKGFWVQDCSAATQNLMLALHDNGVGSVWCGIYPDKERVEAFINLFQLPEGVVPFALVPFGYPDQEFQRQDRFDLTKVHYDKY